MGNIYVSVTQIWVSGFREDGVLRVILLLDIVDILFSGADVFVLPW